MESAEELQQLEITALKSIYADDFIETPPPKAWKGATRLPEFIIRVQHPDTSHATKINFHLNIKLPKTYPTLVVPIFSIQKPISGLTNDHVQKLSHAIQNEAQKCRGSEMIFQIVSFAQEWINENVYPPVETVGSLAMEMTKRAMDEERAKQQRAAEEAEKEQERAARLAEQLHEQIMADAYRQQLAREQQHRARRRANSEATEVPISGETPTESFSQDIEFRGVRFNTVKIFHPRNEGLETVYLADPVCDDMSVTLPLELFVYTIESHYYTTSQGRRKIKQVEAEIQRLATIRHTNLLSVLAVKLHTSHLNGPSQLIILTEQRPAMSLHDVLEDCECLREQRATDYLAQILSALNALHVGELVHRGINLRCIGIASAETPARNKIVKLSSAGFRTRLLDLHKSNSFGLENHTYLEELQTPEGWLSKDVKNDSALLYTRHRDLHDVGIVFVQMLMGHNVMDRFQNATDALQSSNISPMLQQHALNMLFPTKKSVSCLTLLADLAENSYHTTIHTPSIPIYDPKIPIPINITNSPELEYFRVPQRTRQASRWREDWEELELLGKGAFGSVVKARNKIDSRIYAVKKVRLKTMQSDTKIFREVNALSRLSHRFIVRYYTTWVETAEPSSTAASDDSGTESGMEDGLTSVPHSEEANTGFNGRFSIDLNDLDDMASNSRSSFPSIHFTGSSSSKEDGDDDESESDDGFSNLFGSESISHVPSTPPVVARTLYIQMEFVERQTLRERIAEGISEDEAWRLFQQIVDALVHMSTLGILHRDIKLNNIFIDAKGDCKVGDFGLATSSLAAVDPSDVSPHAVTLDSEMTLEVGTRLYIAPEVQSRKRGPRNHNKADMYSLGVVFFEMNFFFSTASERIAVIEDLRKPQIIFPPTWEPRRDRQRKIITWLLQHNPEDRPTALELSQSPLLPPRLEEEYFKGAIRMMAKPDSPHHQAVLSALFNQPPRPVRSFLYDHEADLPEHASLSPIVQERLAALFRLHGAVDIEPPLLLPMLNSEDDKNLTTLLDRHGDVVTLPNNLLVPFARFTARSNTKRIKRYHIGNVYKPNPVPGHPKYTKAALFDIISPDLTSGPVAAAAELIIIANDSLNSYPSLGQIYDIHVSHSDIVDLTLERVPATQRSAAIDIISQTKSSLSQKRALLLKRGLLRSTVDEIELMADSVEHDVDDVLTKLEKISPALFTSIQPAANELKTTVQYAMLAGVTRPIVFRPLMLGSHHAHFKSGVLIEVVRKNRHGDVLAAGGRYDNLIAISAPPKPKAELSCAFGIQIAVEKITVTLAAYQSSSVKTLIKEQKSFGFWSPRRCDVYVVSYHPGYLQERLELAAYLWQHGISADIMYESGLPDAEHESYVDICAREGILFTVYPRPRTIRREQPAFKVKSILKGTEYEITRQELVSWLQQQIAEQKRVDMSTSGAPLFCDNPQGVTLSKDLAGSSDVQLLLPVDTKKQRKQVKQLFLDRAFETSIRIKNATQNGMPILAVDVVPLVFDSMTRNTAWLGDDEAWKVIQAEFPAQHSAYAQQIREAVIKRKAEGHPFVLLFTVREERVQLLSLE